MARRWFWKGVAASGLARLPIGLAVSAGMPKRYVSQSLIRMERENVD
jgi:hypothetical protein